MMRPKEKEKKEKKKKKKEKKKRKEKKREKKDLLGGVQVRFFLSFHAGFLWPQVVLFF